MIAAESSCFRLSRECLIFVIKIKKCSENTLFGLCIRDAYFEFFF